MNCKHLLLWVLFVPVFRALAADPGAVELFDGNTLQGWHATGKRSAFRVEAGTLVAQGSPGYLFYTGAAGKLWCTNFEFSAEVRTSPGAVSAIYFHTFVQPSDAPAEGFKVQINNSARRGGKGSDLGRTGSLYKLRPVYAPVAADEAWFTIRIRVLGKNVQVRVNDLLLVDYDEPAGTDFPRLAKGTFALESGEGRVAFRNLRVQVLPDPASAPVEVTADDFYRATLQCLRDSFPVTDLHTHLKGGLTLEEVLASGRQTGDCLKTRCRLNEVV